MTYASEGESDPCPSTRVPPDPMEGVRDWGSVGRFPKFGVEDYNGEPFSGQVDGYSIEQVRKGF